MDAAYSRALRLLLGAMVITPGSAAALEWEVAIQNRFFLQTLSEEVMRSQIRYPTLTSTTGETAVAYQLHAVGLIAGRPTDVLGLQLGIDSGVVELGTDGVLIDGRDPADTAKRTGFLGETFMDLQVGEGGVVEIRLGKLRPTLGRGAIFDAYAFGAFLDADGTLLDDAIPVSLRFGSFLPNATFVDEGKRSPLFDLEVAYHFDRRTQIRVLGAFFLEGDGSIAPLLEDALVRGRAMELVDMFPEREERIQAWLDQGRFGYDVDTSGWVGWSGVHAEVGFGDLELGGIVLVGFGSIRAEVALDAAFEAALREEVEPYPILAARVEEAIARQRSDQDLDLLSYYLEVDARYLLLDELAIELFGIAMSGDDGVASPVADPRADRNYHAFVSIAPLITKTSIFFGGGIAHSLSSPTIASIAPDGAGLLAGGIEVEWFVLRDLRLRAVTAAMASAVTRDAYGVELGLSVDAFLLDWLVLSADGGVFFPGQHFGDVPIGYQVIALAHLWFED